MYAIKVDNEIAGYSDSFVYIRLHTNGCYVLCNEAEAEGICAKVAREYTDAETGETVNGAQVVADKDSELKNAVSTGDLEAAYREGVNSI